MDRLLIPSILYHQAQKRRPTSIKRDFMVEEGNYLEHTTPHSGVSKLTSTHLGVFVVGDVT